VLAQRSGECTFSKVVSIVALYGKCTRTLTFQLCWLCQRSGHVRMFGEEEEEEEGGGLGEMMAGLARGTLAWDPLSLLHTLERAASNSRHQGLSSAVSRPPYGVIYYIHSRCHTLPPLCM
jgi:hypothetical protein